MKTYLILLQDRIMLRKRSTVETMNNNLRICHIENIQDAEVLATL